MAVAMVVKKELSKEQEAEEVNPSCWGGDRAHVPTKF